MLRNFFYQLEPHSEINALAKKVRLNDFADIQIGGKKFSKNFKQTVHTPLIAFSHTLTHMHTLTCSSTHSHALARTRTFIYQLQIKIFLASFEEKFT